MIRRNLRAYRYLLGAPRHRTRTTAHRNGLQLLKLVNSPLDFGRVEAGRGRASYRAADLARLTADFASDFRAPCVNCNPEFFDAPKRVTCKIGADWEST
jgi:hypothetical protein